jgi:hypothetical protein
MRVQTLFKKPSGFIPVAMSSVALLIVLAHVALVGVEPEADEGAAAHLWQLLMVGQMPLIAYFGVRWVAAAPRQGLMVLATQLGFALMAALPIFIFGF